MTIAYDRRGFGETVAYEEAHSPVEDLLAVVDALAPARPATLIACSQGGRIALDFALRHPSRMASLVLIAPSISGAPEPVYPPEIKALTASLAAAEAAQDWDRVSAIKAHLWVDGPLQREGRISGEPRETFLKKNAAALRAPPTGATLDVAPAFPRLAEIVAPSLVIRGTWTFLTSSSEAGCSPQQCRTGSGHELAGTAHLPSLERPQEVMRLIADFLARS